MNTMNFIQAKVELPHRKDVLMFVTDLEHIYLLDFMGDEEEPNLYYYKQEITDKDMEVYNKLPITAFTKATNDVLEWVKKYG